MSNKGSLVEGNGRLSGGDLSGIGIAETKWTFEARSCVAGAGGVGELKGHVL
jgi:hypothetical protein